MFICVHCRVSDYIATGLSNDLVDPEGDANMKRKLANLRSDDDGSATNVSNIQAT